LGAEAVEGERDKRSEAAMAAVPARSMMPALAIINSTRSSAVKSDRRSPLALAAAISALKPS
jgi:hypothetical protein